ncbi:MAG TPA: type II TA system antitoxin MqsA family protein [Pirellulales bacterium]|nr:type II TA system antitoxin MqsA family protein [Pirellulales bacterium]
MIASKRPPEPFPWLCPRCGRETVNPATITYKTTKKYEGRAYDVEAPGVVVFACSNCGEQLYNNEAGDQIGKAFRATLGLLQPEEIREGRKTLGLSKQEFAGKLRFAEESVSRWETGALVQSRHADTLIRLYFASPLLRQLLDEVGESPDFGRPVCYEQPAASAESPARPIRNLIPD